jgi:hypothetical protein
MTRELLRTLPEQCPSKALPHNRGHGQQFLREKGQGGGARAGRRWGGIEGVRGARGGFVPREVASLPMLSAVEEDEEGIDNGGAESSSSSMEMGRLDKR